MGVRVVLGDDESVQQAFRRFKKLVHGYNPPGARRERPWHKRDLDHHVKPGELARRQALWKAMNKRRGDWRAEHAARTGCVWPHC